MDCLVQELASERGLFLVETLLLEAELGLALDGEFVVCDARAEFADAVVRVFGREEAIKLGNLRLVLSQFRADSSVAEGIAF